ncbi:cell division protein FtsQ [Iocasia frigidifontis]|uniref:Cell division protein FtsQ n=2 Tax=Halanaerobiales TaxID=53433 RepID=A0A8A7K857_9FIRM|nr:cell division protein FtsQ [Halocella sp. SP3-1]QTL97380.1 cell division protein FtsQ [Iocasia fonsfrigidae]
MRMNKGKDITLTQSQKTMVFILAMALFGMADLITEIVPEFAVGPIEFSVSYFAFIPLILCILFDPLYAALGACFGEIIFADLLMGDFGGLGELEGFIQLVIGLYVAGLLVKDPQNKKQLVIASFVGIGIDQMLSSIVDISKVWIGIEKLEAIPGLPESILVLEGLSFINEMVITGFLFGVLPTMYLVPRLHGKIEPLLGIKPREQMKSTPMTSLITSRLIISTVVFAFIATIAEFISEMDINFAVWEPDFLDKYGTGFIWVGVIIAIVLIISIITYARNNKKNDDIAM